MMQSCASAAKLRAAGPFSRSASVPCSNTVSRPLGSLIRQSAEKPALGKGMLFPGLQPAGRRMTPSKVSPVVTKRQSAMTSLRASAMIMVLRVPIRLSAVRARYHNASALSF